MSMCVLGMAEEFKEDNIAVNALWPRTAIQTAAMDMLIGKDESAATCRKVDIIADAAYVILTKDSRNFTGNFCIDEEVLSSVGITDLEQYSNVPGAKLMPDFFLDDPGTPGYQEYADKKYDKIKTDTTSSSSGGTGVQNVFKAIKGNLSEELVQKMNASYTFNLTGTESGVWYLDMKSGSGNAGNGEIPGGKADVLFTMDSNDFQKMFKGNMKPTTAFMTGKLNIKGDMGKAMKLEKLLGTMKSKL